MVYIENLDCPHNTNEQLLCCSATCCECINPSSVENNTDCTSVDNPWNDIKYTLCGFGAQLEYLNYAEINESTAASAEEKKPYEEILFYD